jgi:hypothetical protein
MVITILDFRESDQTANMSIHFDAEFEMKAGEPGLYGMDLENRWDGIFGDYIHQEKNGTLLDHTIGSWVFNFYVRAHAFGRTEFYPYDSWMFNLTLSTPLLFAANKTNFHGVVNPLPGIPGWNVDTGPFAGAESFRLTHVLYEHGTTVTIVLRRAGWQIFPEQLISFVLLLVLGVSLLIPSEDLSSKLTAHTSVIFFIAALLFTLAGLLSPRRFGFSFVEISFYYLFSLASLYLMFAVIEDVCTSKNGILYIRRERYRCALQIPGRVCILALVWVVPYWYVLSYQRAASSYWWINFPLSDTVLIPGFFGSIWILTSLIVLIYNSRKEQVASLQSSRPATHE